MIHFCVLIKIIHFPFFFYNFFCVLMQISLYYNILQNILLYLIIESKMQHVSLPKIYIYTKNQDIDFFTCIKYIIYILQCNHIIVR